jgi:tetratricopeptide (TPR) repeat protein
MGVPAGLLIGYFVGSAHLFDPEVPAPAAAPAAPIPGAGAQLAAQQRVLNEEAALAQDPRNAQGWVALGNDYFDLNLFQKAVDAYGKALTLAPEQAGAPAVLTDQGVMYRKLGQFDQAISNFKKASKLDPRFGPSQYNLGIVYAQDKHDAKAALAAFNRAIEVAPGSPTAEQARKAMAEMQAAGAKP